MQMGIVRRRKLGMSSVKGICNKSETGIEWWRSDRKQPRHYDAVVRWGCTADVDADMIINTASAIHRVNDKAGFREVLSEHGLAGETIRMPCQAKNFPYVIRPAKHAQGRKLFVVNDIYELLSAIDKCGYGWYGSPLFNKTREFRVALCQGRVLWVAEKTVSDPSQVAWNHAQGGHFHNVRWGDWPLKAVRISREAFMLSKLDFGGVDVMVDADNNVFVLEINSAPSQTSDYRQECFAKAFDYIAKTGSKKTIPLIEEKGNWRKFIHPALSDKALTEES